MIFPDLGNIYLNEGDRGILKRMDSFYSTSISVNQSFWSEADLDTRFMAGDQTLWSDVYGSIQPGLQRQQFNFNRIARIVNMIDGHQRNNRKSTVCVGVENADDETADQFTKCLMWVNNQEGVLETISDSFRGSLITGMNLLQVWMDYRADPVSGNIKVDNCSYNQFLIDPFFRKADLSDCNGIWKRSFLTKREVIALLPDYELDIVSMAGNMNTDGRFMFTPESYSFAPKNLLTYDEFYYRDYRRQQLLVDAETGETQEWRGQDPGKLEEFLQMYPQISMVDTEIPTVKLAIVVQGRVMYDGPQPTGLDIYPFVCMMAYYYPELAYYQYRVQGVVRGLRDSQYLYNRRQVIQLRILESQITSGWKFKEGALVNPKDVWTVQGEGRGIAIKDTANMDDVQQIQPPGIPSSMMEITKMLGEEISQISGVNEELLGSALDDKAGILSMLRQGAGLTTLQVLFDHLDRSQKLLGKIMLDLIQLNWTPGKVKKILEGEEPTEQFYNKAFGKYDAAIEEGLNTTTQRQLQFSQLLHLREAGVPIPDSMLLESSTMQNKKKLIESMEQEKQQTQELQQRQAEIQLLLLQSQIEENNAKSQANLGLYNERTSRVQENFALAEERRAEAVRDETEATLNTVRALKELEGIDIAHIKELVAIHTLIKQQELQNKVDGATASKLATPEQEKQVQAPQGQVNESPATSEGLM